MIAATIVDALDGVLARLARVREVLPQFDGARLDDIVDYLTFVFVPVALIHDAGLCRRTSRFHQRCCPDGERLRFSAGDAKRAHTSSRGSLVLEYRRALPRGARPADMGERRHPVGLVVGGVRPDRLIYPTRTPTLQTLTLALGAIGPY